MKKKTPVNQAWGKNHAGGLGNGPMQEWEQKQKLQVWIEGSALEPGTLGFKSGFAPNFCAGFSVRQFPF